MLWYFAILLLKAGVLAPRLNEYISDYEPLFYPYISLHKRQKTEFYFHAFHQDFHVVLQRGSRTLAAQAKLIALDMNSTTFIPVTDVSHHMVKGHVREFTNSSVSGHVFDGIFVGVVNSPQEKYKLDRASDFFSSNVEFGSIIYRYSDINVSAAMCLSSKYCRPFRIKYAPKLNYSTPRWKRDLAERTMSQTKDRFPNGKICSLRIMIDHTFYHEKPSNTFASVIADVASMIEEVDDIFRAIDFDFDGSPDDIGFKIVEFVVITNKNQPGYHHHADKIESLNKYSDLITEYKTEDVCLFLAFTTRDFNGVLGVAALRQEGALGGICSLRVPNTRKYHNVGFITTYALKQRLANAVVMLVAAHEVGHAFGSNHDPETEECSPHSGGGKFIMFPSSPNTHAPNSHKFSPCSRREINDKFISMGTKCFIEEDSVSNCGNGIVDSEDEECDCGDASNCANFDSCCTPSTAGKNGCKYKSGAQCSTREDDCCSSDCKIVGAVAKKQCNATDECKEVSFCNGISKDCPITKAKPDGTRCRKGIGICVDGKCVAKSCHEKNLTECHPFNIHHSCVLSCLSDRWCKPASEFGIFAKDGSILYIPDDESCLEETGRCKNGKCERILSTITESATTAKLYTTKRSAVKRFATKLPQYCDDIMTDKTVSTTKRTKIKKPTKKRNNNRVPDKNRNNENVPKYDLPVDNFGDFRNDDAISRKDDDYTLNYDYYDDILNNADNNDTLSNDDVDILSNDDDDDDGDDDDTSISPPPDSRQADSDGDAKLSKKINNYLPAVIAGFFILLAILGLGLLLVLIFTLPRRASDWFNPGD